MKQPSNTKLVRIMNNTPWGYQGKNLRLDLEFDFIPGQWISIGSPTHPEIGTRMYSIASTPGKPWIDLLYTLVSDGALTPWLWELETNDKILVSQPAGSFVPKQVPSLFIAAGTGVAPFLSMANLIRTGWFPKEYPPVLLHSNRFGRDLFGYHTFQFLAEQNQLTYYPFITGKNQDARVIIPKDSDIPMFTHIPDVQNKSFPQELRITDWIQSNTDHSWFTSFERIMICGSTQMILDIRDLLLSKGCDFQSMVSEVYF